jgi:uncharacterized protein YecT (DUF1311 family)
MAASFCLLFGMPVAAKRPDPFAYRLVMTPEEGPIDRVINGHFTAIFTACQERAVSTQANEACFADEFSRQDVLLNHAWQAAVVRTAARFHKRLLSAQRKWVAQRDPFCRSKADQFRGGTIAPVIYLDCRVEQTIRRTIWLEKLRVR